MKKKLIFFILTFILICCTSFYSKAESDYENDYDTYYEYEINSYHIDITVNEDNTYQIKEDIGVQYNLPKHGIIRSIPLNNNIIRADGSTSKNKAVIRDITVDQPYSVSNDTSGSNQYKKLKIGSSSETIIGQASYSISYTYDIGKDPNKDFDEFYFNLIGPEWEDTILSNITFTISMPKSFDPEKIGFSTGNVGNEGHDGVDYSFDAQSNTIHGSYNGFIRHGQAVTVRIELPAEYFVRTFKLPSLLELLKTFFPVILLISVCMLWLLFGWNKNLVQPVEFYPPDGINSLEAAFLYKGETEGKDVVSLLVYLANKGYLKIAEIAGTSAFHKKPDFQFIKIKDYDGDNTFERMFFNNLFASGEEVHAAQLRNHFYQTVSAIKHDINTKENRLLIFHRSSFIVKKICWVLILLSYVFITLPVAEGEAAIFALLFPLIGFGMMLGIFLKKGHLAVKVFILIWGSMFGGLPWYFLVFTNIKDDPAQLIPYGINVLCIILMVIITKHISKRTPYGAEMLGKLKGFRTFLVTAEKSRIQMLAMKNPMYFYDLLPYAYVLDVSDKWISQMAVLAEQPPEWYDSPDPFQADHFGSFMRSTLNSTANAMTSAPSSSGSSDSSSSGSSGGSSSGGGSGGGGGSSW